MQIERFEMERTQCLYENVVELNLSESGVLPLRVEELVESQAERQRFLETQLLYCESDGSRGLRERSRSSTLTARPPTSRSRTADRKRTTFRYGRCLAARVDSPACCRTTCRVGASAVRTQPGRTPFVSGSARSAACAAGRSTSNRSSAR